MENKYEKIIELVSKVLEDRKEIMNDAEKKYDELYSEINSKLTETLENGIYPDMSIILNNINNFLENILILIRYSNLIGKNVVGIIGSDNETHINVMSRLFNGRYNYNKNIPMVYSDNKEKNNIQTLNVFENIIDIDENEYLTLVKEIYKYKIDINQFLNLFNENTSLKYENISVMNFPQFMDNNTDKIWFRLKEYVDVAIIFVSDLEKFEKTYMYNYWIKKIQLLVYADFNVIDVKKLKEKIGENPNATILDISEFESGISKYNNPNRNLCITDELLAILVDIESYYLEYIKKYEIRMANVSKEIINIVGDSTIENIRSIKKDISNKIEKGKKFYKEFDNIRQTITEKTNELEITLSKEYLHTNSKQSLRIENIWLKMIYKYIDCNNYILAQKYINKLKNGDYKYTYILDMMLNKMKNVNCKNSELVKLKSERNDLEIVLKGKVLFFNEINISQFEVGRLSTQIQNRSGEEDYLSGVYYEKENVNTAIKYYYNSLDKGNIDAGIKLFKLAKQGNNVNIEELAQNMLPEANYELGISCINNNKFARGITYLKIAASLKYIPALEYLADKEYGHIIRKKRENIDEEVSERIHSLISLYMYLLSNDNKKIIYKERIGLLYNKEEDYLRAIQILQDVNTEEANFTLGRIYQYGKGTTQDLQRAKELLKKAADSGNHRALVEYNKVCGWIDANEYKKSTSYSSSRNYSSSSSSSTSSSGGLCFITTATCVALNKQDDCDELIEFKKYRDKVLVNEKDGAELIREYYRIAPFIVEAIENSKESKNIYNKLWNNYITVGYEHLQNENYSMAKQTYINMVKELCNIYNVNISLRYNVN